MQVDYSNYHRDEDYVKMSATLRNIFLTRFKLINRFIKKGYVLEVGASTGEFLSLFKNAGFKTLGIEPSKSAEYAIKKGLDIKRGYFEKLSLPKNYFDLVIMNHTLEHVKDPGAVLEKANQILKDGGVLYVDVPNAGGLGSKVLGKYWPYRLPEEHLSQFNKSVLFDLFKRNGFEVIYWQSRSGFFEYDKPFEELFRRKGFLIDLLILPYSLFVTTFKMGDSITVIGRKK